MSNPPNPFHAGELRAQARAGAGDVASWAAGFIRPRMPQQHREFFEQLPFIVLAGADEEGRHWVTLLDGPEHFIHSPDNKTLLVSTDPDPQDPLSHALSSGTDIGMLGIELSSRRRNRLSGRFRQISTGYAIDIQQSFGNCPQYITERSWHRVINGVPPKAVHSTELSADQITRIRAADTLFIGSGQVGREGHPSDGFDASHRGGAPGFVAVTSPKHIRIPDYSGNNFFNTIGNLLENPKVGLVFVDFETGGLLHVTGTASVEWDPVDSHDPKALRMINVKVDAVVDRPAAMSLRWTKEDADVRKLVVAKKVRESEEITSFFLAPIDGQPLQSFYPGQHLPIEVTLPGQSQPEKRTYSLSAAPLPNFYRISIKREPGGLVSNYLHDHLQPGDMLRTRAPSGDFVLPDGDGPVVLASAGVGVTPMIAMLHALAVDPEPRQVAFAQAVRNGVNHAFKEEVNRIAHQTPTISKHVTYSRPEAFDKLGHHYDANGRLSAETLLGLSPDKDTQFLLCGPAGFISSLRSGLEEAGIPADHIHFETFGPTG